MKKIIVNHKHKHLFPYGFELLDSGHSIGDYNMDFDKQRVIDFSEGIKPAMFRIYRWNPWTVSLGYNQDESQIDKTLLEQKGFDLVRRPTGGRAVLHADELTYSVVLRLRKDLSIVDAYREIHGLIIKALRQFVAGLEFEKSNSDFKEFYAKSSKSVSCFASSARYEIAHEGRKIVGSAQRAFADTLLQHGSILLGSAHNQLADVSKFSNNTQRQILKDFIGSHSANLQELAGRKISYEALSQELVKVLTEK